MRNPISLFLSGLCLCLCLSSQGKILQVPSSYPTIQQAVDAAGHGDTVLVSEGRYFENVRMGGKPMVLGSRFILDGDTAHIGRTIIDGSRFTDSLKQSTLTLHSWNDTTMVVRGLTITGGGGSKTMVGPLVHWLGGGIHAYNTGALIEDNIIEGNRMSYPLRVNTGCGMMATSGPGQSLVVRNNLFRDNHIETAMEADGAGFMLGITDGGYMLCEGNRILNNSIKGTGPHFCHGGGVSLFGIQPAGSTLLFRNNLVAGNCVEVWPGGDNKKAAGGGIMIIFHDYGHRPKARTPFLYITGNVIRDNHTTETGGAIYLLAHYDDARRSSPVCPQVWISGNSISGNRSEKGPGFYNYEGYPILINNLMDNCREGEPRREFWNEDNNYNFLNKGIINIYHNELNAKQDSITGIREDYPVVYSFAHKWKVTKASQGEITMRLLPPPWRAWWAICIYALLFAFFLWLYRRYLFYRFNLQAALKLERAEKAQISRLDQVRSRFFANISHEFRTPLTLIAGPLEEILENGKLSDKESRSLHLMQRNVNRLHQLIRQLLEMARLEAGASKLMVAPGSFSELVRGLAASYQSLAEKRSMGYECRVSDDPEQLYLDSDKVEKILTNLISNALKFAGEGSRVEVELSYHSCSKESCTAVVKVSDTGPGMGEEDLAHIFDRFFRAANTHRSDQEGSGIGLSLVKDLVELYRGEIRVESSPGKGTCFTVELPAGKSQFRENEVAAADANPENGSLAVMFTGEDMEKDEPAKAGREKHGMGKDSLPLVLLAEDNADLRSFIITRLSDQMHMLEAENGRVALEMAIEKQPDLVVSDLMMPEMDGAELVEALRNDERTCHIPLIMLTARADMESRLDCIEKGSDAFMEKPFSIDELRTRIHALIRRRKSLREKSLQAFLPPSAGHDIPSFRDLFLEKLASCIQKGLSDPALNVEELSRQMSLSRTHLYRRVSHLTGFTPLELLRNTRLEAAAHMFRKGHDNVYRVMLDVGYSNASHFASNFKKHFGQNPSEYIRKSTKMNQ